MMTANFEIVILYLVALLAGWGSTRLFFYYFVPVPDSTSQARTIWALLAFEAFALLVLFDSVLGTAAAIAYFALHTEIIPHPLNFLLACLLGSSTVQTFTYVSMRCKLNFNGRII